MDVTPSEDMALWFQQCGLRCADEQSVAEEGQPGDGGSAGEVC